MLSTNRGIILAVVSCLWVLTSSENYLAAQDPNAKPVEEARQTVIAKEKYRYEVSRASWPGTVTFSPDGKLLAARDKGTIVLWETSSGKERIRLEANQPSGSVVFVPQSGDVVGSYRGFKRFDPVSGREVSSISLPKGEGFRSFLPSGKQFLSYSNGIIHVRDAKAGDLLREFRILDKFFLGSGLTVLSEDRKLLANVITDERTIKIWRVESGDELTTLKGHSDRIQGACFSPSGKSIASTGWDKTVRIWDTQTGNTIQKISLPELGLQVEFSPNGKRLAVGSAGKKSRISIYDTTTWQELAVWEAKFECSRNLAFNPQGNLLASAGGSFVQVWELSAGKSPPNDKNAPLEIIPGER